MIETALAVRYDGRVEQGRTSPLRVHVETQSGEGVDVILKATLPPHLTVEGLANEMLASLLAGDLDLPTPKPYFVELTPEFIGSISDTEVSARLAVANPIAFGSSDAGSQWRKWSATDRLSPENIGLALRILAFDAFTGNPDRSPKNPNLLANKADPRLLIIDHECAFGFRMKLFPRVAPWTLGNLSPLAERGADSEHVFQMPLAKQAALPFDTVADGWDGLSEARFAAYDATLPVAWDSARPALLEALGHFRQLRVNMAGCIAELKRILE